MELVEVKVFNNGNKELPKYNKQFDAGFDFKSDFSNISSGMDFMGDGETFEYDNENETITLQPNGRVLIPTGIYISLPDGYELQVRPRSGLALKHGITVLNSPGTIDVGYNGLISIILLNSGRKPFIISDGDRIAQGVLKRVEQVKWIEVNSIEELGESERGQSGFGDSGVK